MYSFESAYGHQHHIPNIPMSMGGGGHHYMTLQPPAQMPMSMRQPMHHQEVPVHIDQSADIDSIRKYSCKNVAVQKETQSQKEWKKAEKYYAKLAKMEAQEKKKKRNKIADEKTWKRNIAKKARNEGKAYDSANGKTHKPAKSLGPTCGCQKKCMETIGMENCQAIFEAYYGMGEWNRQTAYIANLVQAVPVKRRRPSRKKKDKDGNVINSSKKDKNTEEDDGKDSDDHELTCPDGPSCTGKCQQDDRDDDPDSPGYMESMECDVIIKEDYADINDSTVDKMVSELVSKQKKEKEKKMIENCRVKEIFEYYIHFKGKKIRVCKKAFLNIHGVNDRRVYYAVKNKVNDYGIVELDRRGKHANLYRKLPPISSQLAIEHIKMFPRKTFYNPKAKNPDKKKVSGSGLTMREMYEMYLEWMNATHPGITPVAWPTYQKFKIKYFGKLT